MILAPCSGATIVVKGSSARSAGADRSGGPRKARVEVQLRPCNVRGL
jgi:hypothetical protein